MPRPRKPLLERINANDLAYAVDRLVRAGKATFAEIMRYAGERPARIAALEKELRALRAGLAGVVAPGPARPAARKAAAPKPKPKPKRKKRAFTMTPAAIKARKIQGRYLGLRRTVDAQVQTAASKVAQSEGVAAAIKMLEAARKKK